MSRTKSRPCQAPVSDLPQRPGAYALWIELDTTLRLPLPRLGAPELAPGCYAYCGSARGAAGIRARVSRHLRRHKKRHWHVDHLTGRGMVAAVRSVPGGDECALVAELLRLPGASIPVPGFGSTDCRRCTAHLVHLPDGLDPACLGFSARASLLPCRQSAFR